MERRWWVQLVVVVGLLIAPAAADATTYAPLNRPGPKLSVPAAKLSAALQCDAPLTGAAHPPVLLVPGTTLNPATDFSYGWEPTLRQLGYPYCTINLPGNAMADIQTAGEYVVSAIRTMHAAYGGRIDIIGHSQGGMVPRWALRFWPDTRAMVDDLIGLSPSNHGTLDAIPLCEVGCAASIWQQRSNAKFIVALNSRTETFAGVSYTDLYTLTDEVVVPNFGPDASSSLHGGGGAITNAAIQTVCPTDPTEHIGIGIYDHTTYALAMDAITHPGPADLSRVSRTVCLDPLMPGIDPVAFPVNFAKTNAAVATTLATYPHVAAEPRLACYVTATCRRPSSMRRRGRSGSENRAATARRSP
jgi:triacylglycerol esterase/lipase EstA (alpha/beta hydrolase family)